jgi:hypothetical protein
MIFLQLTADLWGEKKSPLFEESRGCTRRTDLIHPDPE